MRFYESESESEVAQSCLTLFDPMDSSLPGSTIHGIFQARVPEWVAISFSRGSSQTRDWTQGLNPSLQHCRQTLYRLSHQEKETQNLPMVGTEKRDRGTVTGWFVCVRHGLDHALCAGRACQWKITEHNFVKYHLPFKLVFFSLCFIQGSRACIECSGE